MGGNIGFETGGTDWVKKTCHPGLGGKGAEPPWQGVWGAAAPQAQGIFENWDFGDALKMPITSFNTTAGRYYPTPSPELLASGGRSNNSGGPRWLPSRNTQNWVP